MRIFLLAISLISFSGSGQNNITKIAFGSCGHQQANIPIFNVIADKNPDLFVFLGDNIYGDTKDMKVLSKKYEQLAAKKSFQKLKATCPIVATWDDHDYGWNDAGKYYPFKKESKELFLDFFEEPADSDRRKHDGIYTSYSWSYGDKTLQLILLDCRTFRSDLKRYEGEVNGDDRYQYDLAYGPHTSEDSTILGKEQWIWLKGELQKDADVRIIGSSTQFGIEFNGYEAWANFPSERYKMSKLIRETEANGVLFISGDVHYAELSKIDFRETYPIYDVTASGLTQTWEFATPNVNRVSGPVMENHFGMISVDWNHADPTISMEIWDLNNDLRLQHKIKLSEISF